jgi:uncharacterized protein (TIGR02284 family)
MSTTLKELQQTLADGIEGFTIAAESVKDPGLKTLFSGFAMEREEMAHELREYARADTEEDASVTGAIHRGWMELKAKLTSGDDHAILAECERGEDHALKVFREDVDDDLPAEARATISSISTRILAVHNKVKQLRDTSQAA